MPSRPDAGDAYFPIRENILSWFFRVSAGLEKIRARNCVSKKIIVSSNATVVADIICQVGRMSQGGVWAFRIPLASVLVISSHDGCWFIDRLACGPA